MDSEHSSEEDGSPPPPAAVPARPQPAGINMDAYYATYQQQMRQQQQQSRSSRSGAVAAPADPYPAYYTPADAGGLFARGTADAPALAAGRPAEFPARSQRARPTAARDDEEEEEEEDDDDGGYNLSARANSMNLHPYNQPYQAPGAGPVGAAAPATDEDDEEEAEAVVPPTKKKSAPKKKASKKSKKKSKSKPKSEKPPPAPVAEDEALEEPLAAAAGDEEDGRRKGSRVSLRRKKDGAELASTSGIAASDKVCSEHGLKNIEIKYTDENYQTLTNYKEFCEYVRPLLMSANEKAPMAKILALLGAHWREFVDKHPYPETVRTAKHVLQPAFDTMSAAERTPGSSSTGKSKKPKRAAAAGKSKGSSHGLKVKLKRKKAGSDDDLRDERNSDEEFEKMLEEADDIYKQELASKASYGRKRSMTARGTPPSSVPPSKKKLKKTVVVKKVVKKPDVEMENQDYCEVCGAGGEIILCDTCPKAYHLVCLDPELEEAPEGKWSCPQCQQEGITGADKGEEEDEDAVPTGERAERSIENMEYCRVCFDGGELLLCDGCPSAFHVDCLNPPLKDIPEGEWLCPRCTCPPLRARVSKILHWRWIDPSGLAGLPIDPEKGPKRRPPRIREFLVKYDNMSYWHCDWVPEIQLDVNQPQLIRNYFRRNNMDDPPPLEEISEAKRARHHDEAELEERFYRYGIRPEWIQVHRIINHQQKRNGEMQYLVKWRDLNYDQSSWEDEDIENVPDFKKCVDAYWDLRAQAEASLVADKKKKKDKKADKTPLKRWQFPDKPTCDPRRQFDQQPDYISATGGELHAYQLEGLNWLRYSWSHGTDTILADEMGLGKTIQTIVFLYSLYKEGHCRGPFIVTAPLSTLINWEREFEMWAPDFYVVTYIGDRESRAVIRENEFSFERGAIRGGQKASRVRDGFEVKFNVLLTSMEMISVDQPTLGSIDWKILVVDEAHRLKNSQSKFFRVLNQYRLGYKLLLTGTPLQNNLEELFHLLNFLSPERFNDMIEFTREFADLSKEDQVKKLHDIMGNHLLRRLKADVLYNMPTKSEFIVRVDMSGIQKKYYKYILTRNYEALHTKTGGSSLINVMMELKKCCNHPYLISAAGQEGPKLPNGAYEGAALVKACGKLELMSKMLRTLKRGGHRVLIFSQMTRMLDLLEDYLEYEGYKYERIDGQITGGQRQDAIDRFNEPGAQQFVFLLSTRAGGLGINLATADTVIIYDSDWNPHNDIQAFSRAHRIGQANKVMIYRFVTRASVEERVTQVAKKKMMLTHLVVRSGGGQFSKKELDDILKFGTEELFKDDNVEGTGEQGTTKETGDNTGGSGAILYDDDAVEKLLDRSLEGIQEKEVGLNEYLSSFKVATYNIVNPTEEEEADEENSQPDTSKDEENQPSTDPVYWERLLRHHFEQHQEDISRTLGKGKRLRRRVNYIMDGSGKPPAEDWEEFQGASTSAAGNQSDDNSSFSSPSDDNDEEDDEFGAQGEGGKELSGRRRKKDDGPLPPLISKTSPTTFDVLGFNPRQRKSFLNGVLRYGIPSDDEQSWQWNVRDLRAKSERHFRAYAAMFMRHLCEPGPDNADTFSDGVPREGISRHHILSRIGITSLIKKKVKEFEPVNGKHSMPELLLAMQKQAQQVQLDAERREREKARLKSAEGEAKEETASPKDKESMVGPSEPAPTKPKPRFMFNICDGGFTELHTLWFNEERAIKANPEHEIWNRKHDYWLLAGIAHHGYGQFNALQNDPRFAIVNEPFKTATAKMNFLELKNKFMQRRFKLLEQALVVEEQIRRAAYLQLTQDPSGPLMQMYRTFNHMQSVAENHQDIAVAGMTNNRPAQLVYRQVLQQLDDLLSDLKSDMSKFPVAQASLPSVSKRLAMSERGILAQLTGNQQPAQTTAVNGAPAAPVPSTSTSAADERAFPITDYYKAGSQFAIPVNMPANLKALHKSRDEQADTKGREAEVAMDAEVKRETVAPVTEAAAPPVALSLVKKKAPEEEDEEEPETAALRIDQPVEAVEEAPVPGPDVEMEEEEEQVQDLSSKRSK